MKNQIIPPDKLLLIKEIPGYKPRISELICMMNYTRHVTLESVKNLTTDELDFLLDKDANSIGALLLHIASTEYYYSVISFEKRDLNKEEDEKWKASTELGDLGRKEIKGNSLSYYTDILDEVRNSILKQFKSKTDEWLFEEFEFWWEKPSNNYFIWYHVFEDEINHRGQINLIRKRLRKKS